MKKKKDIYHAFGNIQYALWHFQDAIGNSAANIEDSQSKVDFIERAEKLRWLIAQLSPNLHNIDDVFYKSRLPKTYDRSRT